MDELPPYHIDRSVLVESVDRSHRWEARSLKEHLKDVKEQAMYCVVHGGIDRELRTKSVEYLTSLPFDGYAIGGLSVGEPKETMYRIIKKICSQMPNEKPRYLMGVGKPEDLVEGVRHGIDMFDCVLPTRCGRNALLYTFDGPLRLRNAKYLSDKRPIESDCPCVACAHTRAYMRHLF